MGTFWWWDDALSAARDHARSTGKRTRVYRYAGMWFAREVGA